MGSAAALTGSVRHAVDLSFNRVELLKRVVNERLCHHLEPRDLNASEHRVEFLPDLVRWMFSAANEPEKQIDVRFEKAEAVDGLHQIGFGPAAEFVRDNQGFNVLDQRLSRMLLAQPRADDPRASKRM